MRILLEHNTHSYKTYHSMAKKIEEHYPGTVFGLVRLASAAEKYIKKQTEIEYEIFDVVPRNVNEYEIDYDELRKFEKCLPYKSLWRIISSDRGIGRAFLHGSEGYEYDGPYDSEYILRYCTIVIKGFRKLFNEFKPDIFIPGIAMGYIGVFINEQICKERNIPYAVSMTTRVKSYFSFADNVQLLFPQIDKKYVELLKEYNEKDIRFSEAKSIYNEIMNDLEDPKYFDRKNSRFNIVKYDTTISVIKWFFITVFGLLRILAINIINKPSIIFKKCRYYLLHKIQNLLLTRPKFYDQVNFDDKYIYYTLHCAPEYSINIQGTMWLDQINSIELLAKSIPADWKVYVKEHPGTLVARTRPINFFKRIKELPNVRVLPIDEDMHKIISNSEMVAVIVGTAGLEAVLRGIPTISFADNSWDVMGLSKKCTDVENLSVDINNEIIRIRKILPSERKKRIICYLAAVLHHSFKITYPNELVATDIGTDEEYEVCGRELADGLVKHLNYLQKEKGYSFGIPYKT